MPQPQNLMCANGRTRHRNQATKSRCKHCRTKEKQASRWQTIGALTGVNSGEPSKDEQAAAMQTVDEVLSEASAWATPSPVGYPGEVFDNFAYYLQGIRDCDVSEPWRREEVEDAERLRAIYDKTYGGVRDLDGAEEILYDMEMPRIPARKTFTARDLPRPKERGDRLHKAARALIISAHYQENESRTADVPRERNRGLVGADKAVGAYVANDVYTLAGVDRSTLDRAIDDLVVNGEMEDPNHCGEQHTMYIPYYDATYHFDAYDRCRYVASEGEHYLALVFPDRELKEAMANKGVENVRVGSFNNGRENGLVYTVDTPSGDTRSFCVYEHRNTDDIVINGITNWDGKELPYAADDKYEYFHSFRYDDKEGAAEKLASFLSGAQKGALPSDEKLIEAYRNS